jgi:aspartate racemase
MKTIGMLGGMSWESTALYYRPREPAGAGTRGGWPAPTCWCRSVDFAQVRELQLEDRWDEAGDLLLREAQAWRARAPSWCCCARTTCTRRRRGWRPASPCRSCTSPTWWRRRPTAIGVRRLGLTGAAATMAEPFYGDRLRSHGLEVLVPDGGDRQLLDRAIFDELCQGVLSDSTRTALRGVLARLVEQGAEAVVLGCTELELLLTPEDCAVPLLPTARLHVEAAVEAALAPVAVPG